MTRGYPARRRWLRRASGLGFALGFASCGHAGPPTATESKAALGTGLAARVGSDSVSVDAVRAVARDGAIPLDVARDRLIRDALWAAGARRDLGPAELATTERGVLARALLEEIQRAARETPPTDDEIDELAKERWRTYDRPPSVVTAHALVRVLGPADDRPAHALADRLATALRGVTDADRFITQARTFAGDGLQIVAERLPPVAADGRVTADDVPGASMDADFSRAANALGSPGETSPAVKSRFGYHVILLLERIPERRVPMEERRTQLREDVFVRRGKRDYGRLLEKLRKLTPPDVDRAVLDLTSRVRVIR